MNVIDRVLEPADGFASREAGAFLAQLDDLSGCLAEDTRGLGAEDLEWQPTRGANTIGMLLAHIAIVEVFWTHVAATGRRDGFDCRPVLGIGMDDDGIPIAADAGPPATLAGRPLEYFDDLLARARAHLRRTAAAFTDADLERVIEYTTRPGDRYRVNGRWILYHLVEHQAGHYGQINLLRHLARAARAAAPGTGR